MITNKDISIDSENGKITLNGNKYDLGTQGEIDTAVKGVYSVMGQMGAKNLIPYPYNEKTHTENGITFTDNGDGTITANGTATDTAIFSMVLGNTALSANGNLTINTNKPLILSGCPSGGGNNTYRVQYGLTDGTTYWAKTASDTGSGVELTPVDGLNSYCFDVIRIMVFEGYTVNNLTFKPMLRLAADTDNTYQPYAKTNKQLTDQIEGLTANTLTGVDISAYNSPSNKYIAPTDGYVRFELRNENHYFYLNVNDVILLGGEGHTVTNANDYMCAFIRKGMNIYYSGTVQTANFFSLT